MCTLEYIPELIESGIYSMKIEGRMKKPEYVALVTAMYRKYVDLYLKNGKKKFFVEPKDREMLMDLYNRGGSYGGYYYTKNGREMLSLTRPNHAGVPALQVHESNGKMVSARTMTDIHKGDVIELSDGRENYTFEKNILAGHNIKFITHKGRKLQRGQVLSRTRNEKLISDIRENIINRKTKEKINGKLILSPIKPAKMTVNHGDIMVEVSGEVAEEAINQPTDITRIEKQMRKTGNTPFEFAKFKIELQGNLFIPMQSLNELRRNALEILERKIVEQYRRHAQGKTKHDKIAYAPYDNIPIYSYIETLEQLEEVVKTSFVKRIYLDCNALDAIWENDSVNLLVKKAHKNNQEIYFVMPYVFRKDSIEKY